MKGATTDPLASISNPPSINITMMMGASHSFFRILRNVQSSFINSKVQPPTQNCLVKSVCGISCERVIQFVWFILFCRRSSSRPNNLIIKPYGAINPKKIIPSTIGLINMPNRNPSRIHSLFSGKSSFSFVKVITKNIKATITNKYAHVRFAAVKK